MGARPTKILLQTTIPTTEDDWSIARFSQLAALLRGATDDQGAPLYDVTMRDRATARGPDPWLSSLDESDFGQLWLFAVDTGDGLSPEDCAAISRFRAGDGGLLVTRDHM